MCEESGVSTAASGIEPTSMRAPAGSSRAPVGSLGATFDSAMVDDDEFVQPVRTPRSTAA